MLYKNLFQLYPDNFQNNYFLLFDKLEDIRYLYTLFHVQYPAIRAIIIFISCSIIVHAHACIVICSHVYTLCISWLMSHIKLEM